MIAAETDGFLGTAGDDGVYEASEIDEFIFDETERLRQGEGDQAALMLDVSEPANLY